MFKHWHSIQEENKKGDVIMNLNKTTKTILATSTIVLIASVLGACGKETTVERDDAQVETQKPAPKENEISKGEPNGQKVEKSVDAPIKKEAEKKKDALVTDEDMLPPIPTAKEMTDVMKTFDSYEEFKGKLAEVGVLEPVASLKNQVLAGDGAKEFTANIHFYQAKDTYFALYEKDDKLLKDFPESIVQHVWTPEDAKAFINERKDTK